MSQKTLKIAGCHQCPGYHTGPFKISRDYCGIAGEVDGGHPSWSSTLVPPKPKYGPTPVEIPFWCPLKKGPVTVEIREGAALSIPAQPVAGNEKAVKYVGKPCCNDLVGCGDCGRCPCCKIVDWNK